MMKKPKWINSKKEYKLFMFSNYNSDLCTNSLDKSEENGK